VRELGGVERKGAHGPLDRDGLLAAQYAALVGPASGRDVDAHQGIDWRHGRVRVQREHDLVMPPSNNECESHTLRA